MNELLSVLQNNGNGVLINCVTPSLLFECGETSALNDPFKSAQRTTNKGRGPGYRMEQMRFWLTRFKLFVYLIGIYRKDTEISCNGS